MEEPRFDDLPTLPKIGLKYAWEHFGPNDELGTLNRLTPSRVREAVSEVIKGERVSISAPMSQPSPPAHGREQYRHELFQMSRNTWDDRLDSFYPQSSTQWDGFRHVRCREFGFYGGVVEDPVPGTSRLSIHHWGDQGIVGRGVLVDLQGYFGNSYDPFEFVTFSIDDLRTVLDYQEIEVRPGDVLCLRFGWWDRYNLTSKEDWKRIARRNEEQNAGLLANEDMARQLWDWGIAAVAADNPTVEAMPGDPDVGSLHRRILTCLGMPIGEYFNFGDLSASCANDGRYSFLFTSSPLAIIGATGAPANALAIR